MRALVGDDEVILGLSGGVDSSVVAALLPMLFENVRYRWALAHPFGNADVAVAEPGDRGLVCLSWCGLEPGVE